MNSLRSARNAFCSTHTYSFAWYSSALASSRSRVSSRWYVTMSLICFFVALGGALRFEESTSLSAFIASRLVVATRSSSRNRLLACRVSSRASSFSFIFVSRLRTVAFSRAISSRFSCTSTLRARRSSSSRFRRLSRSISSCDRDEGLLASDDKEEEEVRIRLALGGALLCRTRFTDGPPISITYTLCECVMKCPLSCVLRWFRNLARSYSCASVKVRRYSSCSSWSTSTVRPFTSRSKLIFAFDSCVTSSSLLNGRDCSAAADPSRNAAD